MTVRTIGKATARINVLNHRRRATSKRSFLVRVQVWLTSSEIAIVTNADQSGEITRANHSQRHWICRYMIQRYGAVKRVPGRCMKPSWLDRAIRECARPAICRRHPFACILAILEGFQASGTALGRMIVALSCDGRMADSTSRSRFRATARRSAQRILRDGHHQHRDQAHEDDCHAKVPCCVDVISRRLRISATKRLRVDE